MTEQEQRDRLQERINARQGKPGVNALRQRAKDAVEAVLSRGQGNG